MTRPDPSLKQQSGVRTFLRVGGPILLVIGGLMTIAAIASFFSSFGSFSGPPENFWMGFVGLPLIAIGGAMTQAGYVGPASRYVSGEVTPTIRDALGALGVGRPTLICAACGEDNDADSRFCDGCGKPLGRACPSCAAQNDADARFCNACGNTLPA
jgi:hypothetical protein